MKMKKVKVITLNGCALCAHLTKELDAFNIDYATLDANSHSEYAYELESMLDTLKYPIVELLQGSDTYYIYLTDEYSKLGVTPLSAGIIKVACFSVENIINRIKFILNT